MNKKDVVRQISENTEITQKVVDKVITELLEVIGAGLLEHGKVSFIGFGTFEVKERSERVGFNPKTLEKMSIPAKKIPRFRAGAKLKATVE